MGDSGGQPHSNGGSLRTCDQQENKGNGNKGEALKSSSASRPMRLICTERMMKRKRKQMAGREDTVRLL